MVLDLTFTLELPNLFDKAKVSNQRQFWRRSLAVAVLPRTFSVRFSHVKCEPDLCYILGLLRDSGVGLALSANVKQIAFFHHEPTYSDFKLMNIYKKTQKCLSAVAPESRLNMFLAREGLTINMLAG